MRQFVLRDCTNGAVLGVVSQIGDTLSVKADGVFSNFDEWVGIKPLTFEQLEDLLPPDVELVDERSVEPIDVSRLDALVDLRVGYSEVADRIEEKAVNLLGRFQGRRRGQGGFAFGKRKKKRKKFGRGLARNLSSIPNRPEKDQDGDGLTGDGTVYERPALPDALDVDLPDSGRPLGMADVKPQAARNGDLLSPGGRRALGLPPKSPDKTPVPGSATARAARIAERRERSRMRRQGENPEARPSTTGRTRSLRKKLGDFTINAKKALWGKQNETTNKDVGPRQRGGFGYPTVVEIGTSGIFSIEDAVKHIEGGGELSDVPDEFLGTALVKNAGLNKRFIELIADSADQSLNDVRLYEDTLTGKRYGLKFQTGEPGGINEDLTEILSAHIAERFGFAQGTFRYAGVDRTEETVGTWTGRESRIRPVLFELTDNYAGSGKWTTMYESPVKDRETVRTEDLGALLMLDFAILNTDRHTNNVMLNRVGEDVHLSPIDHGLSFGASDSDEVYDIDASLAGFMTWANMSHFHSAHLRQLKNRFRQDKDIEDFVQGIEKLQKHLAQSMAEGDSLEQVIDLLHVQLGIAKTHETIEKLEDRINWIMTMNPNDLIDFISDWEIV